MLWVARNVVYALSLAQAFLAALGARPAAALLAAPTMRLFTNDFTPTPSSVIGDFTQADFSGYAGEAVTLAGPVTLSTDAEAMIGGATFIAATATPFVPNTLYGWYLTNDLNGVVYCSERFTDPIAIAAVGDFCDIQMATPIVLEAGGYP